MAGAKNTYFFATRNDMEAGLHRFELGNAVQYVRTSFLPSPEAEVYASSSDLPALGSVPGLPDVLHQPSYLVLQQQEEVRALPVPQRRGGILYSIDQVANPTAMIFVPSGVFQDCAIVVGVLKRTSDPRCHELFGALSWELLKGFSRIDRYFIGPEALRMATQGLRLTHAADASPDYDIRLTAPP